MVYRLPTNHSLVPSPVDQSQVLLSPPVTPWRGSLIVSGTRPSDRAGSQDVRVAALEIDGDRCDEIFRAVCTTDVTLSQ